MQASRGAHNEWSRTPAGLTNNTAFVAQRLIVAWLGSVWGLAALSMLVSICLKVTECADYQC